MNSDKIELVKIDADGKLLVKPTTRTFEYIYREAMEVHWDSKGCFLFSPPPRKWSYGQWFSQIVGAAVAQGCNLELSSETEWINVVDKVKKEIINGS